MKFKLNDQYEREARLYPTLLALLPLGILAFASQEIFISSIFSKVISSTVLLAIFTYFIKDTIRDLGKQLEMKMFDNELFFPTTELLLHKNNTFTTDKKKAIYEKIKNDFNLTLFDSRQEVNDEMLARKKINEAVGLVRQKLDKGRLLIKYNIRYGFWRNLIAAAPLSSLIGISVSLTLMFLLNQYFYCFLNSILTFAYLLIWVFRKELLRFFGYQYANQFFLEYLAN